jgi:pyruvate dehydrogenase E1 component alpha subunit
LAKWLIDQGYAEPAGLDAVTAEVRSIMQAAVKFAIDAPYPNVDEVEKHVYA